MLANRNILFNLRRSRLLTAVNSKFFTSCGLYPEKWRTVPVPQSKKWRDFRIGLSECNVEVQCSLYALCSLVIFCEVSRRAWHFFSNSDCRLRPSGTQQISLAYHMEIYIHERMSYFYEHVLSLSRTGLGCRGSRVESGVKWTWC